MTVDYGKRSEFSGNTATTLGFYSAQLDAFTILGNVYLDLGNWGGFTPYIGAGAGALVLADLSVCRRTVDGYRRRRAMEFDLGRHGRRQLPVLTIAAG